MIILKMSYLIEYRFLDYNVLNRSESSLKNIDGKSDLVANDFEIPVEVLTEIPSLTTTDHQIGVDSVSLTLDNPEILMKIVNETVATNDG